MIKKLRLAKLSTYLTVFIASIILVLKLYGWFATDSMAILASLTDAALDLSSSLINLFVLHFALLPPDHNHRFGHEKIQDLALFAQASFFIGSAIFGIIIALREGVEDMHFTNYALGIKVTVISIILNLIIVSYQSFVVNRTNSDLIKADRLHYLSDILSNISVLLSIYLSAYWQYTDLVFATLINLYIIYNSSVLARKAIKSLVDEEMSHGEKQKVLDVIRKYPEVQGIHELKTRHAGSKVFIQFHLELDGNISLLLAHQISEAIMQELEALFPNSEIIIHQDPAGLEQNVKYKEL